MTAAQTSHPQARPAALSLWNALTLVAATTVVVACSSADLTAQVDATDPAGPAWPAGEEIVCDDDPADLDVYPHGDVGSSPIPSGWLEVERVVLGRVQDQVIVEWTLGEAVPDDIGASPGWGAQLADWTMVVHSGEGPWVVLSLSKEADKRPDIYADRYDPATDDIQVFDVAADGASVWADGRVLYGRFPARYLDGFDELSLWGAAQMRYTLGGSADQNGGFFDGWSFNDGVCGTVETPRPVSFGQEKP